MKRITPFLLTLSALLLAACEEKVIDIDPGDIEKKVVAIAQVEADSTISLRLTYSRFFLDTRPFAEIADATVALTVNGTASAASVNHDGGNYTIAYTPQPGDRLALRVDVPGRGTVTSETTVPETPVAGNVRVTYGTDTYGDSTLTIYFRLSDDGSQANYYGIRVRKEDTLFHAYNYNPYNDSISIDTTFRSYYTQFSCKDVMITDNTDLALVLNDGTVTSSWLPFTDDKFNGKDHEVAISYNIYRDYDSYDTWYENYEGQYVDHYRYSRPRVFVEVISYTRDRYLYEVTTNSYSDDFLSTMFTEPVLIHTNVNGGIGIFAAVSRTVIELPAE